MMTKHINKTLLANLLVPILLGASSQGASAQAQDSAPVAEARSAETSPTEVQCPADTLSSSPIALRLRELGLQPGVRIEPATFMSDPQVAEFIGKLMKQEQARQQRDWSGLCRYRADNAAQQAAGAPDVVFLGDSITENWIHADPSLFSAKVIDRGISGQTSSQILLRFYPDVVALRARVVHIMAGTNDILRGGGAVGNDDIVNNISAMIDIAKANRIKVVLASIPPISVRSWQPNLRPAAQIAQLNARLQRLAETRRIEFVDYTPALAGADRGLNSDLGNDGVHPNRDGYAVMRPLAENAFNRALHRGH